MPLRNIFIKFRVQYVLAIIITFLFVFSFCFILIQKQSLIVDKNDETLKPTTQNDLLDELFKVSRNVQWINNTDFDNKAGWVFKNQGDLSDLSGTIVSGAANFLINGDQKLDYQIISGTINNSQTSPGWVNSTNPNIPVYPRRIASQPLHQINENGAWTSHIWNESSGSPLNPFQKVSAQWDKNVTLLDDMSDFIITGASLQVEVNATVRAYPGAGKDPYVPPYPWGGIETEGDSYNTYFGEGDYINFYIVLSDLGKNVSYRVAEFKPQGLGTDVGQNPYDNLTDTLFEPQDEGDLIFFLNQVLSKDYHNFTLSLGVEINCEDNFVSDLDIFEDIYIKTCDFYISYVKKIDQLSSASWNYFGQKINDEGGSITIRNARLFFDYKIDKLWIPEAPNSEIRIYINDQQFSQTINLNDARVFEKQASIDGFIVTNLIPVDKPINLTIQIFMGDQFGLKEIYTVSIDNVLLYISYDIYRTVEQTFLFQLLLILAIVASGIIGGYLIYYVKIGRFPKPVRKVRKYRKTLTKEEAPKDIILGRDKAFKGKYYREFKKSEKFTKKNQPLLKRTSNLKNKISKIQNKKALILFILLLNGFVIFPFLTIKDPTFNTFNQNSQFISLSSADSGIYIREPHQDQWIKNFNFNDNESWISNLQGDLSDIGAEITNGEASFNIIGDNGSKTWVEDNPLSGDWVRIKNEDSVPLPQVSQLTPSGWYVQHRYVDNSLNQSVKVQWEKDFSLDIDMNDYIITSASLEMWINGTAQAMNADNGGIDRPGDTAGSGLIRIATGDFAQFFLKISDLEKHRSFEALHYQTSELGKDGSPGITELNDTLLVPVNEESLIFYLNEALKQNSTDFAVILGISVWCEDSVYPTDRDYWNGLRIKNFTLSFSYQKKINQFNSISWKYLGNQLESDHQIEITSGRLFFDYKINPLWVTSASPNSEIKIYVNDQEHNESIKLSKIGTDLMEAKPGGFDLTKLIPNNEEINLTLQVFIADNFGLDREINISVDNVKLYISYNLLIPIEQSIIVPIVAIIISALAVGLGTYFIAYQRFLKYPKQVRKVRKYRKTLDRAKEPDIQISDRKKLIESSFNNEVGKQGKTLTTKSTEKNIIPENKTK